MTNTNDNKIKNKQIDKQKMIMRKSECHHNCHDNDDNIVWLHRCHEKKEKRLK